MVNNLSAIDHVNSLKVKIYADGANIKDILELAKNDLIKGFTTNPTLMNKQGITDYEKFARELISYLPSHPISLEVFADDLISMERQARTIASWGGNINVKIPVTNTKGEFTGPIISKLSQEGIVLNVTAIMTLDQVRAVGECLAADTPSIVSVFAGRIADTGRDPLPLMTESAKILENKPKAQLLWASCRELLNILHAEQSHCKIITVTTDILKKLSAIGKCLDQYSLETVQMFYNDAVKSNFSINTTELEVA